MGEKKYVLTGAQSAAYVNGTTTAEAKRKIIFDAIGNSKLQAVGTVSAATAGGITTLTVATQTLYKAASSSSEPNPANVNLFVSGSFGKVDLGYHNAASRSLGAHSLNVGGGQIRGCLLYTSPSPRDATLSRMPSSA